jgi:aspartate kinase
MGQTTNQLIELAHKVSPRPPLRELDMLLTTGERISMALLSMALNDLGCPAISFTGSQAGILTDDAHVNANIIEVKAFRVEEALKQNKVVILAGFQGVSQNTKEVTTLGRGGSDISAVAMASYLNADRCEILKDVDCIFTADPKLVPEARPILQLHYQHLLDMTSWGAKVLHHRSVKLAAEKKVNLFVGSAANPEQPGTVINHGLEIGSQVMLAVNSFSNIFEVSFLAATEFKVFQNFLQQNQIGLTQLLFTLDDRHFFTAPQETLNDISEFEARQNFYKILKNSHSSVSATYSRAVGPAEAENLRQMLVDGKIGVFHTQIEMNSIHFLIGVEQRNAALQILHNSIKIL